MPVSSRPRPPGPKGLPLLGSLHRFWRDPLTFLKDARSYGDLVWFRLGPYQAYLVSDPDLIKTVLVNGHKTLEKRSPVQRGAKQILGEGLATSEGDFHLKQRRLIQPAFHRARIEGYARDMVNVTANHIAGWRDGAAIDVSKEMMQLTLAIVGKTLFDAEVGADAEAIGQAVEDSTALFNSVLLPFPELRKKLPLPSTRKLQQARARLDTTIYRFIHEHRASGVDRGDLLSMLLQTRDEDGTPMPDQQIRDEAMTLFAAGHETSANALTWAFYLLSQHPDALAAAVAEVESVVGDRLPTMADVPRLAYLRRIANETLRLYPPGWLMTLVATQPFPLGDHVIPEGAMVLMCPSLMHRDPRYFPEPDAFRPERWTTEMQAAMPKFSFFPFGGGPRVCIGEQFAWTELVLVLAVILSRWRFELAPAARVEIMPVLTLRAKYGMPMILRHRAA